MGAPDLSFGNPRPANDMDTKNDQNNTVSPGANMPVDRQDLQVKQAPVDPLKQVAGTANVHAQGPMLKTTGHVEQYSHSQLEKKRQKTRGILLFLIGIAFICALALPAYIYGPKIYRSLFVDPNKEFSLMLTELMSVNTEFHNIESSGPNGIFSARYDRDSTDFFNPKSNATTKLDFLLTDISIDAQVKLVGVKQGENSQNLNSLSISRVGTLIGEETKNLVEDKWVSVPTNLDYQNEGLTISFFQIANGFNTPYRFLPIGNLPLADRTKALAKIDESQPYRYDCQHIDDKELVSCEVSISHSRLADFYTFLASESGETYSGENNWPETFTVFIDTKTHLPNEIRLEDRNGNSIKQVMAFGVKIEPIVAPVGELSIGEYRALASEFENSL